MYGSEGERPSHEIPCMEHVGGSGKEAPGMAERCESGICLHHRVTVSLRR